MTDKGRGTQPPTRMLSVPQSVQQSRKPSRQTPTSVSLLKTGQPVFRRGLEFIRNSNQGTRVYIDIV